jgi:hypothetical protein
MKEILKNKIKMGNIFSNRDIYEETSSISLPPPSNRVSRTLLAG